MHADGTNAARLTSHAADDDSPAWSPDGSRIAFVSDRDGNREIYVMYANGSRPTRLTNAPASDSRPAWSPDGSQIAFTSFRDASTAAVFVMNADGSGVRRLAFGRDPAWSGCTP